MALGYRVVRFQFVVSRTLLCLLLTNVSQGDSGGFATDVMITVTRLADGDEVAFPDPFTCSIPCPVDSTRNGNSNCACKCRFQFTWRQDLGRCVQSSGCDFTVMNGNYVPAMKLQSKLGEPLLPDMHALRRGGTVLDESENLQIYDVYILGENRWRVVTAHDFYLASVSEKGRNVLKVKSKTQSDKIGDYDGTLVNFTLNKKGNDVGCVMVKIRGDLTYDAGDFKVPVFPTIADYPDTKPPIGVGGSTATGTLFAHSSSSSAVATIPHSRVATSSPSLRFSSPPSVGGSTMISSSETVTTAMPRSTEGSDQTVTTAMPRSTEDPDQTITTAMPRSTEGPDQTVTTAMPRSTEGPDQTMATATDGLDAVVSPSVSTGSAYSHPVSTQSTDLGSGMDLSTTAVSRSVFPTGVSGSITHSHSGDGTASTIAKPSLSPVIIIDDDPSALQQNDDINAAAIAGGVVAGLTVLLLIVVIVVVIYRRNVTNASVKIGEHEFESTVGNPMYNSVADSEFKAISVDNAFHGGQETVPNTEATTVAHRIYEDPAEIFTMSISPGHDDVIYEDPLAITERKAESVPVPVVSNGYTSMIPQVDQPASVDQTYTGLVDDSLYEDAVTIATE